MAGIAARPLDGASAPETLPWAVTGTTLEPTPAQEAAGWLPSPAPPPDHRLENWHRFKLNGWLERLGSSALFVARQVDSVGVGGTVDVGDTRRVTIGAHPVIDYVTVGGDTNTTIAQAIVAAINASAAAADVFATWNGATGYTLTVKAPGVTIATNASVFADVGTVDATHVMTGSSAAPFAVRLGEDLPTGLDFNFSLVTSLDTAASAFHFRKAKSAFRAGEFTATAWNDANTGAHSTAFGLDTVASGGRSFAVGDAAQALSTRGVAMGGGQALATAGVTGTVAIGWNAQADGEKAVALGTARATGSGSFAAGGRDDGVNTGAYATATDTFAQGTNARATSAGATAIGTDSDATTGTDPTAIGTGAQATAQDTIAIGTGANASQRGGIAIGRGTTARSWRSVVIGEDEDGTASIVGSNTAEGAFAAVGGEAIGFGSIAIGRNARTDDDAAAVHGAIAIGRGSGSADIFASGIGAMATGGARGTVAAHTVWAIAHGSRAHGDNVRAEGEYSHATGQGALAESRGERAHSAVAPEPRAGGDPEQGKLQHGDVHSVAVVTSGAAEVLTPDNGDSAAIYTWIPRGAQLVELAVVARHESNSGAGAGVVGDMAAWKITFASKVDAGGILSLRNLTCIRDNAGVMELQLIDANLSDADAAVTVPVYYESNAAQYAITLEVDGSTLIVSASGTADQNSRFSAVARYVLAQE